MNYNWTNADSCWSKDNKESTAPVAQYPAAALECVYGIYICMYVVVVWY